MQRRIQDRDWRYSVCKKYVSFLLRSAYRNIEYSGLEKIPKDGAVIYSPNHTNALMDALVVLSMESRPVVFVARADIFRKPRTARILHFLRIMPIMRRRDGLDEVRKNDETIRNASEVLKSGIPFCILPEGTHRTLHSLLPLGKGIFRIAVEARECIPPEIPLYIVPVGIEYGNYFRFRSTVLTQIGEPINVGEFVKSHSGLSYPELYNEMRGVLTERMKELILYIPDDEWYEATYELCAIMVRQFLLHIPLSEGSILKRCLKANRQIVSRIEELRAVDQSAAEGLLRRVNVVRAERSEAGISRKSISSRVPFLTLVWRVFVFVITLPYTLPAGIATLPVVALSRILHKKMPDYAFYNSIRYASLLLTWPFWIIVYSAVAFYVLPWPFALLVFFLLIPAYNFCHDAVRLLRLIVSDMRLMKRAKLQREISECRAIFNEIMRDKFLRRS